VQPVALAEFGLDTHMAVVEPDPANRITGSTPEYVARVSGLALLAGFWPSPRILAQLALAEQPTLGRRGISAVGHLVGRFASGA